MLLGLMVAVPPWAGARRDDLRGVANREITPARTALLQTQIAFTSAVVESRAFLVTRDTVYRNGMRRSLQEGRTAFEELSARVDVVGPEAAGAMQELAAAVSVWLDPSSEFVSAVNFTNPDSLAARLALGERRLEDTRQAAARVHAVLDGIERRLDDRVAAWERTEDAIVAGLGLAAAAVTLFAGWLMRRLVMASRNLAESEERFRQIAENVREAIWIADPEHTTYYYINPAQQSIWGRPIEAALRDPMTFLARVHPEDRARAEATITDVADHERDLEYRVVLPDEEVRWIRERIYPVRDANGRMFRVAGIAEDVTERKRSEAERELLLERERWARGELETAVRIRDTVLRIVSHDLKNPLHTLGMAAELLEMPLTREQRQKQIGVIHRTIRRANRLVLDLLDASRVQAGKGIAVEPTRLAVLPLVEEAIETFRLPAGEKQLRLTCDLTTDTPDVLADHDRILQVLSNLLSNAVKFTPERGNVRIKVERTGPEWVRISVCDTGPGIRPDLVPNIFDAFAQAKDTASLGTGLGLAIAKGIVEAHGGRIAVVSRPGEGATFWFTLPVVADNGQDTAVG
jgi:PAS domain S-box-containing protein